MDGRLLATGVIFSSMAAALGCRTVDGTRMLLHQFCGQVELYTGMSAPFDVMSQALLDEIARVG